MNKQRKLQSPPRRPKGDSIYEVDICKCQMDALLVPGKAAREVKESCTDGGDKM